VDTQFTATISQLQYTAGRDPEYGQARGLGSQEMNTELETQELKLRRGKAVKTALVLGFIALAIFAAFIGAAVMGR
jgi:hypothetical protein